MYFTRGLFPLRATLANPCPGNLSSENLLCFKIITRLRTIEGYHYNPITVAIFCSRIAIHSPLHEEFLGFQRHIHRCQDS